MAQEVLSKEAENEILVIQAAQRFGTVALTAGEVFINEGEAIIEDPEQIKEMKKLLASGRAPHLRIKAKEDISKELAAAEAKVSSLKALATRSMPRTGMTSTAQIAKGSPSFGQAG